MKKLHQVLNINSVHDKYITGIKVDEKNVCLSISKDCNAFEVVFVSSESIKFDNFKLGNIILSIEVYGSEDVDIIDDELRYLLNISKSNSHNHVYFERVKKQIKNGELFLIAIDPSYGLEGYVLCKDIKIGL